MLREIVLGSLIAFAPAGNPDPKFFANEDFQVRFPAATILHVGAFDFLKDSVTRTLSDAEKLVNLIRNDSSLSASVKNFPKLSPAERIEVMRKVFALEVRASGLQAPELLLDSTARKMTFFDFDPKTPGTGKVILNPERLFADENHYAALLFLIHETRHSFQFQVGFSSVLGAPESQRDAFHSGFLAQKAVFDEGLRVSFCDFLTLNQEYEAFLFGNYVMEELTDGAVDTSDMGTLASQYLPGTGFRLDLLKLRQEAGPDAFLGAFNEAEMIQYREMHP